MVSWGKQKGVIRVFRAKKAVVQVLLIAAGIAMVCFGALRGEAGAVLNKAMPAAISKPCTMAFFARNTWITPFCLP